MESVDLLTASEARELTEAIRLSLVDIEDLIGRAFIGQAWTALGYENWDAYCSAEFTDSLPRLSVDKRRELVGALHDSTHMSNRAIAAAIGVDHHTVGSDLRSGGENSPPEPDDDVVDAELVEPDTEPSLASEGGAGIGETIDALWDNVTNGAERPWPPPPTAASVPPPPPIPAPAAPRVTGADGKSYPAARGEPVRPKRSPLPETAERIGWDIRKAAERLVQLSDDDRFTTHQDQVATHLRSHLTYTVEVCQDLLDRLASGPREDR